jgi:hypothetical protein
MSVSLRHKALPMFQKEARKALDDTQLRHNLGNATTTIRNIGRSRDTEASAHHIHLRPICHIRYRAFARGGSTWTAPPGCFDRLK